jgi:hypothetical protein
MGLLQIVIENRWMKCLNSSHEIACSSISFSTYCFPFSISICPAFYSHEIYCRQLSAILPIVISKPADNYQQFCRQLSATKRLPKKWESDCMKIKVPLVPFIL